MSIQDDAERIRVIASSDRMPQAQLRAIQGEIMNINTEVMGILGQQSSHLSTVGGAAAQASEAVGNAVQACLNFETALHDAADGHARG